MISSEASASRTIEVNTWWIQDHDLVTAGVVEDLPGTHSSNDKGAGCCLLSVLLYRALESSVLMPDDFALGELDMCGMVA